MESKRTTDMSLDELRSMITQIVDERLAQRGTSYKQRGDRPLAEIIASMRANIIKRQPGEPSVPDMIREERDR
jgi:hypothetical protein